MHVLHHHHHHAQRSRDETLTALITVVSGGGGGGDREEVEDWAWREFVAVDSIVSHSHGVRRGERRGEEGSVIIYDGRHLAAAAAAAVRPSAP